MIRAKVFAAFIALALASAAQAVTLHVSKLGDDSDGASWATAFRTIQRALDAVPDAKGGHTIVVRPDTYMESNLFPAHPGTEGAYNTLVGDRDGALGSGASGWAVIDCSDPEKGFKSYDWYGPIRAYKQGWSKEHTEESFSAIDWDRWTLRHLYATGGDGGLFFDTVHRKEPFSAAVEDCVSIGRAFGGGVAGCLSRRGEPIAYRRCHLWALDWWGDTAGAYVRVEHDGAMPDYPDAVFEDCTLVGPQCSLKTNNFGMAAYTRVALDRCRLITLNFSQPAGTPTDGIVQVVEDGKYLHADFTDCTLMGYKVFGVKVHPETAGAIRYTANGATRAYVQFQQDVPAGMLRLGHWPVEVFDTLMPPPPTPAVALSPERVVLRDTCEVAPVMWEGRPHLVVSVRPASGGTRDDYWLALIDETTREQRARFAAGHSLASALVHDGALYAFASRFEDGNWNDVTCFSTRDLAQWDQRVAIEQDAGEHLFNSSVCAGPDGFVMAYETNDPQWPAFTIKFARSRDLKAWEKIPGAAFGTDRYAACPAIRYARGHYYLLYLEHRTPRWHFETWIARSNDLAHWTLSPRNPVLAPRALDDGINASDPDLLEADGRTRLYYAVGDQRTWMHIKRAAAPQPLDAFLESWFE